MRDLSPLDSLSFRPFYFAAHTLNFTEAARRAGMTQSGVSQHIAKLENALGTPLFLRVKKKVLLTEAGAKLRAHIEKYFDEEELLRDTLKKQGSVARGLVTYAMPGSCLATPHFAMLLAERGRSFPEIDLGVSVCPSPEVIEKLLDGEIDFGFVTQATGNPAVTFTFFCEEEYVLISRDKAELKGLSPRDIKERRFLRHPGVEIFFDAWYAGNFPKAKPVTWDSLNVVGGIDSLDGVIRMVEAGVGLTCLPLHCVEATVGKKRLYTFRGEHRENPRNPIHIVTLAGAKVSRRVQVVIDTFLAMVR